MHSVITGIFKHSLLCCSLDSLIIPDAILPERKRKRIFGRAESQSMLWNNHISYNSGCQGVLKSASIKPGQGQMPIGIRQCISQKPLNYLLAG